MSVDRPTFSENWHRVDKLKPRLLSSIRNFRQQFRGRMWHVLADPANNQYFRLDAPAYYFIGLLDGRRTISEAWDSSNTAFGDSAPTQGEVIRLLGQLYTSNLLHADLPPDAQQMFSRYHKRVTREVRGYLSNFLFVRVPLFDPNRILNNWVHLVGWVFGPVGILLWAALIGAGFYFLAGHWGELLANASPQELLKTENAILLYFCFAGIKAIHEFGHGFACKHFGRKNGVGGDVHTMGIMLLVFAPVPYVDASSSWAFRSRWQRAFVGAAGMYVELAVAAIAAIVWASTGENQLIHSIAYNLIFIASVSTLLFNANPLLRFDGYYIFCDLVEIANLYNRSKQYIYYLVRRYVYGVRNVTSPAHTAGERFWMPIYAVCAFIYRIIVFTGILLYVSSLLFILGLFMAFSAFSVWVVKPLGSFGKYLFINPELERVRTRALAATGLTLATIVTMIGIIPFPDRDRGEGVVEPVQISLVHMETDGFIEKTLPSGILVDPDGPPLIQASNEQLLADWRRLEADLRSVTIRRNLEQDPALKQALEDQMRALGTGLDRIDEQLEALEVHAPFAGVWVSPDAEHLSDAYLERGERVGMVADLEDVIIRAAADQLLGPRILDQFSREGPGEVELRVRGRPDLYLKGTIAKVSPAGTQDIISPALGYLAGGSQRVDPQNPEQKTAEPFFEVRISDLRRPLKLQAGEPLPEKIEPGHETTVVLTSGEKVIGGFVSERADSIQINVAGKQRSIDRTAISELSVKPSLLVGQRVAVRFTVGSRPLAVQWWRSIGQMLMRRFSLPSA